MLSDRDDKVVPGRTSLELQDQTAPKSPLELRLFPVFDLRRHHALTLFCVPVRFDTQGALKLGHWLLNDKDEDDTARVDLGILDTAIAYAKRFAHSNATAAIGAMVSFKTLISARHRKAYIDKLHTIELPQTNPLLVQIEGIPAGTPMQRIADAVNQVGQTARRVLMTIPSAGDFSWNMGAIGATGIGINLTGREGRASVMQQAHALMNLCRSQGALGYMNMLMTRDDVTAVAASGVRFGTGPALNLTLFTTAGPLPRIPIPARQY